MDEQSKFGVVLVVDDEPYVLSSVSQMLARAGFAVLRAASGNEALRVGLEHREPIHLLLADVLMPDMSGPSLADRFAVQHPETQRLFMAGLPDHPEVLEGIIACGYAFLPKPFFPRVLVDKVREVLGSPARASAAPA